MRVGLVYRVVEGAVLFTLATATGATTAVGPFGQAVEIEGLAFGPAMPASESGTLVLPGIGILVLSWAQRGRTAARSET